VLTPLHEHHGGADRSREELNPAYPSGLLKLVCQNPDQSQQRSDERGKEQQIYPISDNITRCRGRKKAHFKRLRI
jgi:hypothetical protein